MGEDIALPMRSAVSGRNTKPRAPLLASVPVRVYAACSQALCVQITEAAAIKAPPPINEKIRRCNSCIRRIFIWENSYIHLIFVGFGPIMDSKEAFI